MSTFRILSLDGGGILGAFTASVLAAYEADCLTRHNKRLIDHFDLITGTSTGGIIAIGLAMGVSAAQILEFYQQDGPKIFPRAAGVVGWAKRFRFMLRNLVRPKFRPEILKEALTRVVSEKALRDAETCLVIPSYNTVAGEIYLFKTPHHDDCVQHAEVTAVDVALATSAAPTYFPAHEISGRGVFIDGGVWGNCPADIGIVEAVSFFGHPITDIRVLSISTTSNPFRISGTRQVDGLFGWATKIIDTFMFSQTQAAVRKATCLLRDRAAGKRADRFHRIDFVAEPGLYTMDDARAVAELVSLGRTRAEQLTNRNVVQSHFLNGCSAPRHPWKGGAAPKA